MRYVQIFKTLIKYSLAVLVGLLYANISSADQFCELAVSESTGSHEFIVHEDGTVTHKETGLMWMQCSLGQTWNNGACDGDPTLMNWPDALSAAGAENFANHNDWRLPNLKELFSIIENQCYYPTINLTVFPNTPDANPGASYWSSTPAYPFGGAANFVSFYIGSTSQPQLDSLYSVRLVRQ